MLAFWRNWSESLDRMRGQLDRLIERSGQSRASSRQAIYLGQDTALTTTHFGRKIFVDTRDISLAPHLLIEGEWEMWITRAMQRVVKPGMKCVDLGSNFGWYSLLMAHEVGNQGSVLCVDANSRMVELLGRSLSVNGFVGFCTLRHNAIGQKQGKVQLNILERHAGSSSLNDLTAVASQYHDRVSRVETVEMVSLDMLVPTGEIDLVKIDCEGLEPEIILGGTELLSRSRNISMFMEYAPGSYDQAKKAEMLDYLTAEGFRFWRVEADSSFSEVAVADLLALEGWQELYVSRETPNGARSAA